MVHPSDREACKFNQDHQDHQIHEIFGYDYALMVLVHLTCLQMSTLVGQ